MVISTLNEKISIYFQCFYDIYMFLHIGLHYFHLLLHHHYFPIFFEKLIKKIEKVPSQKKRESFGCPNEEIRAIKQAHGNLIPHLELNSVSYYPLIHVDLALRNRFHYCRKHGELLEICLCIRDLHYRAFL